MKDIPGEIFFLGNIKVKESALRVKMHACELYVGTWD